MLKLFKKKKKKVYDKWALFIISTLVVSVGIGSELFKGTRSLSDVPSNPAFDDINFYKCVVDAFNKENDLTFSYETNLTDEELNTISELSCSGSGKSNNKKIKSIKGIEKIKDLNSLILSYNLITEVDLSENVNLEILKLEGNKLYDLNIENNTKLQVLYLNNTNIREINLVKNIDLIELDLSMNYIALLDVSNNVNLKNLWLQMNFLKEIDVSNNVNLEELDISMNFLTSLDVSYNTKLAYLYVFLNKLTMLDISNNVELVEMAAYNNKLSKLDFSKNIKLESLNVSGNKLTEIDVSNNVNLEYLNLNGNSLAKLDLSNNLLINDLSIDSDRELELKFPNNLSYDDLDSLIDGTSKIKYWDLGNNKIINVDDGYNYYFANHVSVDKIMSISSFVDGLRLTNLNAQVYDNDVLLVDGNISEGNILKIFDNDDNLIDELDITIFDEKNTGFKDEIFYNCIVDAYNDENDTELSYSYILSDEELEKIKNLDCYIYSSGDLYIKDVTGLDRLTSLELLNLSFQSDIKEIDLSNNKLLKNLILNDTSLDEINVSNNLELERLDVSNNFLTELDVSNNTKLKYLSLYNDWYAFNALEKLNIDNNLDLIELDVSGNALININVENNENLEMLSVSANYLKEIDVSKNLKLKYLYSTYNYINEIDVSKNLELKELNLLDNYIKEIDVSKNLELEKLNLSYNSLKEIDVSNNNKLTTLNISNNLFEEILYGYKGSSVVVGNNIKLPSVLDWGKPTWKSNNSNVVSVDSAGDVVGLALGSAEIVGNLEDKYRTTSIINVVEITSDKYIIDEVNDVIFVFDIDEEVIKSNINLSHKDILIDVDMNNFKLQVIYNDEIIKEFNILLLNFGELVVDNNIIAIRGEFSYEDFISNIDINNESIRYDVVDGDMIINSGNITDGMKLIVYYNDEVISTYNIFNYNLSFNDNILTDEDSRYLKYKPRKSTIEEFLGDVIVSDKENVYVADKDNNKKNNTDSLCTGDKLFVYVGNDKISEYEIAVRGDASGDGRVSLIDLSHVRKHIAGAVDKETGKSLKKEGIYFYAIDINDDNRISLIDLSKVRKIIVGADIDAKN